MVRDGSTVSRVSAAIGVRARSSKTSAAPRWKLGGEPGRREGVADFVHLPDPARRVQGEPGHHPVHGRQSGGLALLELGVEGHGEPVDAGRGEGGRVQGERALGDRRVDHLHRRPSPDVVPETAHAQVGAVEGLEGGGVGAAAVEAGGEGGLAGGASDDPGVDEGMTRFPRSAPRPGAPSPGRSRCSRRRRDGRSSAAARRPPRPRSSPPRPAGGWRGRCPPRFDECVERFRELEPGRLRELPRPFASPREAGRHPESAGDELPAHSGAHVPGALDPDRGDARGSSHSRPPTPFSVR